MDNACSRDKRDIYAPCDVKCVRNLHSQGFGLVLYQSVNKVRLRNGRTDYISMWLMHDNNASRWQVGKVYKQGEQIYSEGDADPSGLTTAIHVHYEVAIGLHSDRIKSHDEGRYHIVNQVHPDQVFFRNGTTLKRSNAEGSWKGDHTYSWIEFEDGNEGGGGIDPHPTRNKELLVVGNTKNIGVIKIGTKYEVIKNTGKELTLRKIEEKNSLIGQLAIINGGKGKTLPMWNMKGKFIENFKLDQFQTWQFLIEDVGGNGDIIVKTNKHGFVRLNPKTINRYKKI